MSIKRFSRTLAVTLALSISVPLLAAEPKVTKAPKERKQLIVRDGRVLFGGDGGEFGFFNGSLFPRTYVGVNLLSLSPELKSHFGSPEAGTLVSTVAEDSPAAKAGLRVGDVITAVNGQKITGPRDVSRAIHDKKAGDSIRFDFLRGGVAQHAFVSVAEREPVVDFSTIITPEMIKAQEFSVESAEKLGEYFRSPEWKARIEQFQDCGRVQGRVRELETRLRELEKRLEK